jgi:hypothetical protein
MGLTCLGRGGGACNSRLDTRCKFLAFHDTGLTFFLFND